MPESLDFNTVVRAEIARQSRRHEASWRAIFSLPGEPSNADPTFGPHVHAAAGSQERRPEVRHDFNTNLRNLLR